LSERQQIKGKQPMVDRTLEYEINQLIHMMRDSVDGYAKAAELTVTEELRELFTNLGERRREFVQELSALENIVGGDPVEEGTLAFSIYRTIKELNVSVSGDKDGVILNAVKDVLSSTIKRYETILGDHLSITKGVVKDTIEKQYRELQETLTKVNELIDRRESK
jgi:uncharacterized protein (TIGR02284 family)